LVVILAFAGGCAAALGPVEPLSKAELGEPIPARPSLLVPFSDANADPRDMTVDQFFPSEVVERDHGTFSYDRQPIWAPVTRDRAGDRELARRIEAVLAGLRWHGSARSAVWTGERLIALFYGGPREEYESDWVTAIAVFAPGVPEATAMPDHAWRLHINVEDGPFVLSDGRLLFTADEPFARRFDASGSEERLELPSRPAVLTFDAEAGVGVVAELHLEQWRIDAHDRIWGTVDGWPDRWLVGLRVDGRPFFGVELEGFGHGWIQELDLTADGPCVGAYRDFNDVTRCFGLDGRPRNEGT
jgi:hypothetical protein